jgi:hypothetical protein
VETRLRCCRGQGRGGLSRSRRRCAPAKLRGEGVGVVSRAGGWVFFRFLVLCINRLSLYCDGSDGSWVVSCCIVVIEDRWCPPSASVFFHLTSRAHRGERAPLCGSDSHTINTPFISACSQRARSSSEGKDTRTRQPEGCLVLWRVDNLT